MFWLVLDSFGSLVNLILSEQILCCQDLEYDAALDHWMKIFNPQSVPDNLPSSQKEFDKVVPTGEMVRRLLLNCEGLRTIARFFVLQEPESNAWLNALPSSFWGLS